MKKLTMEEQVAKLIVNVNKNLEKVCSDLDKIEVKLKEGK